MTDTDRESAAKLADRLASAGFGLCVEGETPTILLAMPGPDRDLIVTALRAYAAGDARPSPPTDVREATIEECARVADQLTEQHFSRSHRSAPVSRYRLGYLDGIGAMVAAIRFLSHPEGTAGKEIL
jgi:hypothetical protein